MTMISWNIRGMNTPRCISDVLKLLTKFKPTIVGLVENKLNSSNLSTLSSKIPRHWDIITNNTTECIGRILTLWDTSV